MRAGCDFQDVDRTGDVEVHADYLARVSSHEPIAAAKRARDLLLGLGQGGSALDVGCGLGDDAARLAALVGPDGRIVAVDSSAALLERAASTHPGPVEWRQGDAHSLPFRDGEFDAARVERTLMHVARPGDVLSEMTRVVRADGVVLACEPDWGTLVLSGDRQDLVDGVSALVEGAIRNARVGRNLAGMLMDVGVADVRVTAETLVLRTAEELRPLFDVEEIRAAAVESGLLTHDEADDFKNVLTRDAESGRLVAAVVLFTAWGRVAGRA
jgi:SAM-dependent methyltransferase